MRDIVQEVSFLFHILTDKKFCWNRKSNKFYIFSRDNNDLESKLQSYTVSNFELREIIYYFILQKYYLTCLFMRNSFQYTYYFSFSHIAS